MEASKDATSTSSSTTTTTSSSSSNDDDDKTSKHNESPAGTSQQLTNPNWEQRMRELAERMS